MRRIRIAHIVEAFEGGVLTYMLNVLPKLNSHGCDVTLVCSLNRNWPALEGTISSLRQKGIRVLILSMSRQSRPVADTIALVKLCKIISKGKFDIVHTHCSKAGALGRIAARIVGTKAIVHTPHCFSFLRCNRSLSRQLYLNTERILGMITSKLMCVSHDEASVAVRARIVPISRCAHVNNSLKDTHNAEVLSRENVSSLRRAFDIPQNFRVVLTVCRLVQYKGVFDFLEAARLFGTSSTVFLVAGEGELKSAAEAWIRRHGLGYRIRMLGHVNSVEGLYSIADVVVLCSKAEGQAYVLLEAMRAGKPIVATVVPGNMGVVRHEINGYLVSQNASSIAGAINRLLSNENARRRYGGNARAHFLKYHLLDGQISKLTNLYSQLISKKPKVSNAQKHGM